MTAVTEKVKGVCAGLCVGVDGNGRYTCEQLRLLRRMWWIVVKT